MQKQQQTRMRTSGTSLCKGKIKTMCFRNKVTKLKNFYLAKPITKKESFGLYSLLNERLQTCTSRGKWHSLDNTQKKIAMFNKCGMQLRGILEVTDKKTVS